MWPASETSPSLARQLKILCRDLDPNRLFFWANVSTVEEAEALLKIAGEIHG